MTIVFEIIGILFGLMAITVGFLQFNKKFVDWEIEFSNAASGVKTNTTAKTYSFHKFQGVLLILVGIGIFLFFFFLGNSLPA